jgi:hypothetical protein
LRLDAQRSGDQQNEDSGNPGAVRCGGRLRLSARRDRPTSTGQHDRNAEREGSRLHGAASAKCDRGSDRGLGLRYNTSPTIILNEGSGATRFCTINIVMAGGAVSEVNYRGPTGGLLTRGEQCAYAVDACVRPRYPSLSSAY